MNVGQGEDIAVNGLRVSVTEADAGKANPPRDGSPRLRGDQRKIERILAMARALLAASLVPAIYFVSRTSNGNYLYPFVLPAYCAYGLGLIVLYRRPVAPTHRLRWATHIADIVWAGALMLMFSDAPYSLFAAFLIFPLFAAALRWGFGATTATAAITLGLALMALQIKSAPTLLISQQVETAEQIWVILGSVSLLTLGCLLGLLGEHEKKLRSQAIAIARTTSQVRKARSPNEAVATIFKELCKMFEPSQIQLAIHEIPSGRIHLWESNKTDPDERQKLICQELDFSRREDLLFESGDLHLLGVRSANLQDGSMDIKTFDPVGKSVDYDVELRKDWFPVRFRSFMCVPVVFGSEWEVRLFIWDPGKGKVSYARLRALADVAGLGPTIFTAVIQLHLRNRAVAEERARFACELHDGILQSLAGLDLRMEVMKRMCSPEPNPVLVEVGAMQRVLRSEISNLRELVQHGRRSDLGPRQLAPFLSDMISTFQRDTGITARFFCDLGNIRPGADACYEVARIVQEALTNVRRHSGAKNVIVRFAEHTDEWILIVMDDGRGFDFAGRCTLAELDACGKGPAAIKQRVRAISGSFSIESGADKGARLEITFPKEYA